MALILLREQHRERERAEEAERRATAAARDLEVVRDTAVSLAHTEDIGAGIAVLARHLRMDVALLDQAGEMLLCRSWSLARGIRAAEPPMLRPACSLVSATSRSAPCASSGDRELTRAR